MPLSDVTDHNQLNGGNENVTLDETTAIFASLKQRQPQCTFNTLDQHCADIRSAVVQNPDLLSDACEQLLRVKSFLSSS